MTAKCYRVVLPTLMLALMLEMMPLPEWAGPLRPNWLALVMIYWAMALPEHVGVNLAWVFGLLLDVTQGAILGQHAIGMVLIIYLVHLQYQRIRVFSLVQQAIVVFFLLIIKQLLVLWASGIIGRAPDPGQYFFPSLIGAMIWPWLFVILRDLRRRFTRGRVF